MNIQKAFGLKVQQLRKESGMSQERFALSIDMDRTYLASVEAGKRNISLCNIEKIAKGLNIEVPQNYYIDDDPEKGPIKSWRCHANMMYTNWLNYYVYQVTPYEL